jgi:hypothetical protein
LKEDSENSQGQLSSELQARKLESEITKNKAERDKLNIEAKLYAKNVKCFLIKWVVAGIVAAGLLAVWAIGYFEPIISRKQEMASLDNEIQKRRNELRALELAGENKTLKTKLAQSIETAENLKARLASLANLYDSLSAVYEITSEQRKQYVQEASSAREEVAALTSEIDVLRKRQQDADVRAKQIISSSGLKSYKVILILPSTMSDAEIFVDGEPATILDRTLSVVTILVTEKETNHRITVKKGDRICTKEQLIRQDNLTIYPCQ